MTPTHHCNDCRARFTPKEERRYMRTGNGGIAILNKQFKVIGKVICPFCYSDNISENDIR